jgi:predicted DNA-binding transcriptional regulator YafY
MGLISTMVWKYAMALTPHVCRFDKITGSGYKRFLLDTTGIEGSAQRRGQRGNPMARGDQLSRQWKIIQYLMASHGGKTAVQLAEALECHPRTTYRDLEALQGAGFPLYTEQRDGRTHWSMLDADRHQMPLPLSLTELMALYFSRNMLEVLHGTAIHDSLTGLFEKVKATLPDHYLAYLNQVAATLGVGVKARKPYEQFEKTLSLATEAAGKQCYIAIDYYTMSRRELTRRRVAPYKVWFYDETFYIIGHCDLRGQVRLFAVDRIEAIRVLPDTFEAPPDFDAEAFMRKSFGVFQGEPVSVEILFTARVAGYVSEKIWHPSQELDPRPDGTLIFRAQVAGLDEIKHWLLRWGANATVLTPMALRKAMAAEAEKMLDRYHES